MLLVIFYSTFRFSLSCVETYSKHFFQIAGLTSFWRLFRGKKWNPLRMRVDTLPHSPDVANHRFYTGTLIFTMLLFLLPTTALYYAIFALLRVATLCVQKLLRTVAVYMACFPWFSLLNRIISPLSFATHARFNHSDVFRSEPFRNHFIPKKYSLSSYKECHVKDLTVLEMLLDVQPVRSVVCSELGKALRATSIDEFNLRRITAAVLSGKLLR